MIRNLKIYLIISIFLLAGCAARLPLPVPDTQFEDRLSAAEILADCVQAHGGQLGNGFDQVHLSVSGTWGSAIKRIQPLVTDFEYRIDSQEIYYLKEGGSKVQWSGPEGTKVIEWDYPNVKVFYNGIESKDPDVLASSAMTSSTFELFHLGPSVLARRGGDPVRLSDEIINGTKYHRLYFLFEPGFGLSQKDEVVAYVDARTKLLYRVWLTLEGYRTTEGATVDVTFLDYKDTAGYLLPSKFDERVRAPISIHAHSWWNTRMELVK